MNWGYKILTVIVLFVIGMGVMLSVAMQQKNEMIDSDYYVKELHHQQLIDAAKNLNSLPESLTWLDSGTVIRLHLPVVANQNKSEASIVFLRPSDQRLDRTLPLITNGSGDQLIAKNVLVKGEYKVRVSWKSNDVLYYNEQNIFIQ